MKVVSHRDEREFTASAVRRVSKHPFVAVRVPPRSVRQMPSAHVQAEEIQDLAKVPAEVCSLFDSAETLDFQSGLDWYRLLKQTTLAPSDQVSVLVARRDGRPTAALPLRRSEKSFGTEIHSLTNFYTSLFAPVLAQDARLEDLEVLFSALRRQRPRARAVVLSPLDHGSQQFPLLSEALKQSGFATFDYFCFGNWYLPLSPVTSSADQYLAERPGEVRQTLRRMSRRFDREQGHIEIVSSDEGLEDAIKAYASVYAASWKRPEPHPEFMPGLIRLCARRGWLRLGIARVGERPVAAQLWIVAGRRACIYKLAYDLEFARLSPGSLLTAALMRHAIEQDRVTEVDYLTGDDDYKRAWMTHRRERWGLVAYNSLSPAGAFLHAREVGARLAKRAAGFIRSQR